MAATTALLLSIGMVAAAGDQSQPVLYGYDMVSYFVKGFAVKGSANYACAFVTQDCGINDTCVDRFNSTFYFESQENLETFEKDPWKYAPKYGGFGADGIANEKIPEWPWSRDIIGPASGPEDSWKVYNGSLYLNFSPKTMETFFEDADENVAAGDARWIALWGKLDAGPFDTDCLVETFHKNGCLDYPQVLPAYPSSR